MRPRFTSSPPPGRRILISPQVHCMPQSSPSRPRRRWRPRDVEREGPAGSSRRSGATSWSPPAVSRSPGAVSRRPRGPWRLPGSASRRPAGVSGRFAPVSRRLAGSGNRLAGSGEPSAAAGQRLAATGGRLAADGERIFPAGERLAAAGERSAATGEPSAAAGRRTFSRQRALRKAAEISSIRLRFTPKSLRPRREADRKWMRLAASSKRNSTSSTKRKISERHSALR